MGAFGTPACISITASVSLINISVQCLRETIFHGTVQNPSVSFYPFTKSDPAAALPRPPPDMNGLRREQDAVTRSNSGAAVRRRESKRC